MGISHAQERAYLLMLSLAAGGWMLSSCQYAEDSKAYQPRAIATVPSTQLTETAIMPTLDTPLPNLGNAVWCATFQVAWNRLRDDLIGAPLRVANAQPLADRLNRSPVTEGALPPRGFYAAAGQVQDGIIETIRSQMSRQFPGAPVPDFPDGTEIVAYAFLDAQAAFTTPFSDTESPIAFSDAAGVEHSVAGFGLNEGADWDWDLREKQVEQVKLLFSETDGRSNGFDENPTAFALDLTADHREQELIVAVMPRPKHLRAALEDLARRIAKFAPDEETGKLQSTDTLKIPNVVFSVDHEYAELQGADRRLQNPGKHRGLHIACARQSIRFALDKSGAAVASRSDFGIAGLPPRRFVAGRPFLVVMKRRSADQPYFVAWIENAELLDESRSTENRLTQVGR